MAQTVLRPQVRANGIPAAGAGAGPRRALAGYSDVVFVCGAYKSGTSLLTYLLSREGYLDPSTLTNARERAYGQSTARYDTHECQLVRRVNEILLPTLNRRKSGLLVSTIADSDVSLATDYLSIWKTPIVVKDPRFLYTLITWLAAAHSLGRTVTVCFTVRPQRELMEAWIAAPYTRSLFVHGELQAMQELFYRQRTRCLDWRVPCCMYELNSLKRFKRLSNECGALRIAPPNGS
jgi:hypothetical protein